MPRRFLLAGCATALALAGGAAGSEDAPAPPILSLPIDCTIGRTCFVQQYFDHDPGPGAKDYRCGLRVYDGHDGTDIRLPTIAAQQRGVAVLASAAGIVRGLRDGEADHLAATDADRAAVKGRDCGNGVLIEHPGGWQTQYCHMAKGSIRVAMGQQVRAGDRLGLVGLSGDTQFPHVHLSVRQGPRKVDPFAPDAAPNACGGAAGRTMWSPQAAAALAYRATEIINAGFADAPLAAGDIDAERFAAPATTAAPAMAFFGRAIGLEAGDRVTVRLVDPDGQVLAERNEAIDTAKAQWMAFAGRKRPPAGWRRGTYRGSLTIVRSGRPVVARELSLRLE